MPHPRRILLPNTTVFVTSRTIRGLPFKVELNHVIESAIARAQTLYPIKLCAILFMGNHFHAIIHVEEPRDVVDFIDRLKTETAHAVNTFYGTHHEPVWQKGYDAVPMLTEDDVIEKFVYLYTNPSTAGLTSTIDQYKSVSTWNMFVNEIYTREVPWISRTKVMKKLTGKEPIQSLAIEPMCWVNSFGINDTKEIKEKILTHIYLREQQLKKTKKFSSKSNHSKLMDRSTYKPTKYGKRMWCICQDKIMRMNFINILKDLIAEGHKVYKLWKQGNTSVPYPPGLFPPSMPKTVNLRFHLNYLT